SERLIGSFADCREAWNRLGVRPIQQMLYAVCTMQSPAERAEPISKLFMSLWVCMPNEPAWISAIPCCKSLKSLRQVGPMRCVKERVFMERVSYQEILMMPGSGDSLLMS